MDQYEGVLSLETYDGRKVQIKDPLFRFPVNYIGITRGFTRNYHGGVDLGWNSAYGGRNQPLLTPGKINRVRTVHDDGAWNGGYGNYITLESDGFVVLFGHCLLHSFRVRSGEILAQGIEVCRMNNSGNSAGDHLHYEVYLPGSAASKNRIDPMPLTYVYSGQTVSANTALREQIKYYQDPSPPEYVGVPVKRDPAADQLEVTMKNLNARAIPNLGGTVYGYLNPGIYTVTERKDCRNEAGNGYLWHKTGDGYWCAFFESGQTFMPKTPENDWKRAAALSKEMIAGANDLYAIAKRNGGE